MNPFQAIPPSAATTIGKQGTGAVADHVLADGHLLDALAQGYRVLGFGDATGGDGVFRDLVLARIIEPTSKLDTSRVLEEAGAAPASYPTVNRRLRECAKDSWRQKLAAACAAHARLGPASLVLYDVSTLYFEADASDGFRGERVVQGAAPGPADHQWQGWRW
jgi:hypothetical protein